MHRRKAEYDTENHETDRNEGLDSIALNSALTPSASGRQITCRHLTKYRNSHPATVVKHHQNGACHCKHYKMPFASFGSIRRMKLRSSGWLFHRKFHDNRKSQSTGRLHKSEQRLLRRHCQYVRTARHFKTDAVPEIRKTKT